MPITEETYLIYDGSFEGFLTCVFEVYNLKLAQPKIIRKSAFQESFFASNLEIRTDPDKAERVWNTIKKKTTLRGKSRLYYAFLSGKVEVENLLLNYIQYALKSTSPIDSNFSNPTVLTVSQIAKSVGREKHRMEAFVRFRLTQDNIYFATIEPDFDVLPLITKHFKSRYADQKWIIYDLSRNYGIYYNLQTVETITLELPSNFDPVHTSDEFFSPDEMEFQKLWQDYFKSTNIPSRKNLKLHIQHIPKRYWKYLSEKQV
ncbi:DNA metabolism protein [Aequorivita sp. H23M31]|uniref:DNA metabolism protein n=1 Tax=Aequorivita ciconiae TaxID=2494375 RepID=A0A410G0W7_9FLAO|nr:TIGR03915 family putative DNA repair protein [Aequorivita sp. H23M31]QAA80918.1 DNA metabolism protein [Aequorivita sp. H23M31]